MQKSGTQFAALSPPPTPRLALSISDSFPSNADLVNYAAVKAARGQTWRWQKICRPISPRRGAGSGHAHAGVCKQANRKTGNRKRR